MPIVDFFGNFHPLLVHLPIGILLVSLLLVWGYYKNPNTISLRTLRVVILLGAVTATLASATGYLISQNGSYDKEIVDAHQWLGIGLTLISWCTLILSTDRFIGHGRRLLAVSILSVILLFATGHAGGTLTHGTGFLDPPPYNQWFAGSASEPTKLDSSSLVYDAVHLVFSRKCLSCHGTGKQRGGLRLDAPEYLHEGGDGGPLLIAGNAEESLLVQRLLLPPEDEKHMPPQGRTQPTQNEIELLRWWVDNGASYEIRLADAKLPVGIVEDLLAEKKQTSGHPLVPVEAPEAGSAEALMVLRQQGAIVLPVSESDTWLEANLLNVQDSVMPEVVVQLAGIRDQLIWLSCTGKSMTTTMMEQIGAFENLRKVDFRNCRFESGGLQYLSSLEHLKVLNLSGSDAHISDVIVVDVTGLEVLNLGLTGIDAQQLPVLKGTFPKATIETTPGSLPI